LSKLINSNQVSVTKLQNALKSNACVCSWCFSRPSLLIHPIHCSDPWLPLPPLLLILRLLLLPAIALIASNGVLQVPAGRAALGAVEPQSGTTPPPPPLGGGGPGGLAPAPWAPLGGGSPGPPWVPWTRGRNSLQRRRNQITKGGAEHPLAR